MLLVTAVTAGMTGGLVEVRDRVAATVITVGAVVVAAVLVSAVVFVVMRGWRPLLHLNFYTHDMSGVGPKDAFDQGGVLHAIVGSLIQIGDRARDHAAARHRHRGLHDRGRWPVRHASCAPSSRR